MPLGLWRRHGSEAHADTPTRALCISSSPLSVLPAACEEGGPRPPPGRMRHEASGLPAVCGAHATEAGVSSFTDSPWHEPLLFDLSRPHDSDPKQDMGIRWAARGWAGIVLFSMFLRYGALIKDGVSRYQLTCSVLNRVVVPAALRRQDFWLFTEAPKQ